MGLDAKRGAAFPPELYEDILSGWKNKRERSRQAHRASRRRTFRRNGGKVRSDGHRDGLEPFLPIARACRTLGSSKENSGKSGVLNVSSKRLTATGFSGSSWKR